MLSHIATTNSIARPPLIFTCSGASPEWKLNMAMLLQAVFEQDEQYCNVASSMQYRVATKTRLAEEARKYVASDDFIEMCNLTGVDASFMRALTPYKAREAYSKLMDQQPSGIKLKGDKQ
jgi:uncharacterized metal-binding protein